MATLAEIRQAIADAVKVKTGVECYANLPPTIVDAPCAYVKPVSQARNTMGRGFVTYNLALVVVAALADDDHAQETLDDMLATGTARSMTAVFDQADPMGAVEADIDCPGWGNYGLTELAGTDYLTADLELVVRTAG